jgi:hypothetical protein
VPSLINQIYWTATGTWDDADFTSNLVTTGTVYWFTTIRYQSIPAGTETFCSTTMTVGP